MKDLQFPLVKTKTERTSQKFDLSSPVERKKYFNAKVGPEIEKLRDYLSKNSFIAYFIGKKGAGKGTYSKLFREVVDSEHVEHFSVGDMIREIDKELEDEEKGKELMAFLEKNYRGFYSLEDIIKSLEDRSTRKLLPTDLILLLIKREISKKQKKTLFIDGFPRNMDQVSHSLFFRDLIDHREDPDIFVLIDIPETVIDARIKTRVVCPKCQTSRGLKLLVTSKIGYDEQNNEFYLICDNPVCEGARMVPKEGDKLGIKPIRERLLQDEELLKKTYALHGIPKILLRNHIPVDEANKYVDDYEITPEYSFEWNKEKEKVEVNKKPFVVFDDRGIRSYSLLAPPVVISMIKQMVRILGL